MKKINVSDIGIVMCLMVFVVVVILSSFVSKSLIYEQNHNSVELAVKKKEFVIYAQTNGILAESNITVGQHVTKGEVIGRLTNESLDRQIDTLSSLMNNESASTQLSQLQAEKAAQTLYSPTNGFVAEAAAQGEAINNVQKVATIYSDDAVHLVGDFSYANYNLFQQSMSSLTAVSLRNNQRYSIEYGGTFQEVSSEDNKNSYVSLFFTFTSPNDARNVLQNEEMRMKIVKDDGNSKPIDLVRRWYDGSVFFKN